jgi:hypothetical protein
MNIMRFFATDQRYQHRERLSRERFDSHSHRLRPSGILHPMDREAAQRIARDLWHPVH